MLNFTQTGTRTARPEDLSGLQKVGVLFSGVNIPKPVNDSTPAVFDLPFETHRFRVNERVELEAWSIPHVQSKGIVLMFHGYAEAKSSLLPEASAFHEMGYTTFLVDFRGSGGSNQSKTSVGFYEADDVTKAVEYAQRISNEQPLILYGRSMGGAAILRAIHNDEIEPDAVVIEAVFDRMLSTIENRFSTMGIPSFPAAQLLLFWGSVQSGYSGFQHNPADYAASVGCPVLVLHGREDPRVTTDQAEAIFQRLSGEKEIAYFENVGHESYLVVDADTWKQTVSSFLARYEGN